MARRDVVVIGASAGGLPPLTALIKSLPTSLPACVLVVMHSPSNGSSVLPEILSRSTSLPVAFGKTGDPLEPGRIYVARPDFHLIITSSGLRVVHGPRENGLRPAIDPLFRSAAREFGPRVIGVVLSGALGDGTYGLGMIKLYGGIAIAQDPEDAIISSMPLNAINRVDVDHVLPARDIGVAIERLTGVDQEREGGVKVPPVKDELEPQLASQNIEIAEMQAQFGRPSALTCPDCGGALWEIQEADTLRYQCHVGHQYAPESLEEGQRRAIDGALWSAVRALEEHADLKMRVAARIASGGLTTMSEELAAGARVAREQAHQIRTVLLESGNGNGEGNPALEPDVAVPATAARRKSHARGRGRSSHRRPRR